MKKTLRRSKGFTILELSIILVIIGLMTGGILAGQSLYKSSELNSVMTETRQYAMALNQFRMEYNALPGDFDRATEFWGLAHPSNTWNCRDMDKSAMTATCDGNGDSIVDDNYEMFLFWHHLKNAGLIEGSYTGKSGIYGGWSHQPWINSPGSNFQTGNAYAIRDQGYTGSPSWFNGQYGHIFMFGQAVLTSNLPRGRAFIPNELWKLDKKFDDGKPGAGQIVTRAGKNPETPNCTEDTPGGGEKTDGRDVGVDWVYRMGYPDKACTMIYRNLLE